MKDIKVIGDGMIPLHAKKSLIGWWETECERRAKLLQVTGQTLINWQRSGDLKPIKLAGKRLVRYRMDDIQSLLLDKNIK